MRDTYLYVKQHTVTGKLYFGKTTKYDPNKYLGSGKYWKNHIKKHGAEHVITKWVSEPFTDKEELVEFALSFSELYDIVESQEWANLKPENGIDGNPAGIKFSEEHRRNISAAKLGKSNKQPPRGPQTEEHKQNISASLTGRVRSEQECKSISEGKTGVKFSEDHKQNLSDAAKTRNPRKITDELRESFSKGQQNRPIAECPHCQKTGTVNLMKRYHFDNCKHMNKGN